jgi:DNA replication protein DnaC
LGDLKPSLLVDKGIGKLYHSLSLSDFSGDQAAKEVVQEYVDNIHKFREAGIGICAFGEPGTGKTFLMVEILKAALRTCKHNGVRYNVRKTSLGEVIHYFTNTWYDKESIFKFENDLLKVDFLLIDDLEKAYLSEGNKALVNSALDKVLRTRVDMQRPILITTNEKPESLKVMFGDPISSLLAGHCRFLQVTGKDFRREDKARSKWNRVLQ